MKGTQIAQQIVDQPRCYLLLRTARAFRSPAISSSSDPTKVELIVYSTAAKALGITVPLSPLGRTDDVIEQRRTVAVHESAIVLVFGRRDHGSLHTTR